MYIAKGYFTVVQKPFLYGVFGWHVRDITIESMPCYLFFYSCVVFSVGGWFVEVYSMGIQISLRRIKDGVKGEL